MHAYPQTSSAEAASELKLIVALSPDKSLTEATAFTARLFESLQQVATPVHDQFKSVVARVQ